MVPSLPLAALSPPLWPLVASEFQYGNAQVVAVVNSQRYSVGPEYSLELFLLMPQSRQSKMAGLTVVHGQFPYPEEFQDPEVVVESVLVMTVACMVLSQLGS